METLMITRLYWRHEALLSGKVTKRLRRRRITRTRRRYDMDGRIGRLSYVRLLMVATARGNDSMDVFRARV